MKTAWGVFLAGLCVVASVLSYGQSVKGSIDGVVRDGKTSQPVAGVRVTLGRYTAAPPPGASPYGARGGCPVEGIPVAPVITDSQGKFEFKDVDPGDYRLTVQSNGYVRQDFGQKTFPGQGPPIRVGPGSASRNLSIQ